MTDEREGEIGDAFTGRFCATAPPVSPVVSVGALPERLPLATALATAPDVELRTKTRMWGYTVGRGLFGSWAFVVAYGAIGREPRRRTEWFDDVADLERRRRALLAVRERHGYVIFSATIA